MVGTKTTERRIVMIVVNFSHPITEAQKSQIEILTASPVEIRNVRVQVDQDRSLMPQIQALLDAVGFASDGWQQPLIINLPGLAIVAVLLVQEIKQRAKELKLIRLQPVQDALTVTYRVAELLEI
jgi:hypothetical protein